MSKDFTEVAFDPVQFKTELDQFRDFLNSKKIIRERVTEIERPNWWPTDEEIKASLAADASVTRW